MLEAWLGGRLVDCQADRDWECEKGEVGRTPGRGIGQA